MADRVERTVQAQREFVANASHQLRTPLTGMKLRLGSAAAEAHDQELRSQVEAAEQEVDRMALIVERLLVMARDVEEGRQAHVDVGDAVERAVERWQERASAAGSRIASSTEEGIVALGDPHDLDQVLDVVLDNAISYAPGPIEVRIGRNGARAVVSLRDHGAGIPPDEVPRVTERFYRGRDAPPGGSGLGLSIAKELVETVGWLDRTRACGRRRHARRRPPQARERLAGA